MGETQLKTAVYEKLLEKFTQRQGSHSAASVCYFYPKNFQELPVVSYYEIYEGPATSADDQAYLTIREFMVDIWAAGAMESSAMGECAKEAMAGLGFKWLYSMEAFEKEPCIYHKASRFRLYE